MIETIKFADSYKIQKILPKWKKTSDLTDITLLPPINIISILSKITEKVLVKHIVMFLILHNLIPQSLQDSFKNWKSTMTALLLHQYLVNIIKSKSTGALITSDQTGAYNAHCMKLLVKWCILATLYYTIMVKLR